MQPKGRRGYPPQQKAVEGLPCVDVDGLLGGGEVRCLKAVDSHPEVVSSPLAVGMRA